MCIRDRVENGVDWGRLGDTDEYFWKTPEEIISDIDDQYSHRFEEPNK